LIEPELDLAKNVLLGVLRTNRLNQPAKVRQVTGRRGAGDSLIESHDITRQRSPTRAAGEANPFGIDVLATGDVVDGADGVPDAVAGRIRADQDRAHADQKMFLGRAAEFGPAIRVQDLGAFPLANRILGECGNPLSGQRDGNSLVVVGGFGGAAVSARYQDDRMRRFGIRQIERGGDVMLGLAFEEDFLEAITSSVDFAHHLSVQWRALRKPSQLLDEELSHSLLISCHLLRCFQLLIRSLPVVERLIRLLSQVRIEQSGRGGFTRTGFQALQILSRLGGQQRQ